MSGVTPATLKPGTATHVLHALKWEYVKPVQGATHYLAITPLVAIGTPIANSAFWTLGQNVRFNANAGTGTITWEVIGENQFGVRIRETFQTVDSPSDYWTLNCFRRVFSLTPIAGTPVGITVRAGYTDTAAAWRLPMYAEKLPAVAIRGVFIKVPSGASVPVAFTVDQARSAIQITPAPPAGQGDVIVHLNREIPEFM